MAVIDPIEITTKDGRSVTIRSALPGDAKAFNIFMRNSFAATEMLIRAAGEYGISIREERKRLQGYMTADHDTALIAVADNTVVGLLNTRSDLRRRAHHNVEFGISVTDGWQGQGLGRAMMLALIGWAEDRPKINRLELHVLENNTPAIRLYEDLGFEIEGRREAAVKLDSGRYIADLMMRRWVRGETVDPGNLDLET